jgi:pimeloyl-ACP methyl ester carboxylesterase
MFITINGLDQWVSVYGGHPANPALMLVSGAGLALSRMAPFFQPWESAFRVVYWDQPGAGATLERHGEAATGPITFDRLAADGIAAADAMREQLGVDRLILLGISGGSIVGLKMVKARPDLFAAYVGTGQIVRGADVTESTEGLVITPAEQAALAAMPRTGGDQRAQVTKLYEELRGAMTAFNAYDLGLDYAVPMLFLQGALDRYTPTDAVAAFANDIIAPRKRLVIVDGGGHAALFLRDEFLRLLIQEVKSTGDRRQ